MVTNDCQARADVEAATALAEVGAPAPEREISDNVLRGCKTGSRFAFQKFVERYQVPVFAVLSRMLGHGSHVEDLAQETFLRAWKAFPGFEIRASSKPSTWLLTIAVRLALSYRRKDGVRRAARAELDVGRDVATPEADVSRRALGRAIAAAIEELPPSQRAVFVLQQYHGLSGREIAVALDTAENTVKSRLGRARSRLQRSLAAYHPSFPDDPLEEHASKPPSGARPATNKERDHE
ncbi:MAG: RNA polymerase sigma factor [Deltaproteobacteria bacterium]|nr:RNA polymerase sigma factor [Deltaproteobacteria bacterium]